MTFLGGGGLELLGGKGRYIDWKRWHSTCQKLGGGGRQYVVGEGRKDHLKKRGWAYSLSLGKGFRERESLNNAHKGGEKVTKFQKKTMTHLVKGKKGGGREKVWPLTQGSFKEGNYPQMSQKEAIHIPGNQKERKGGGEGGQFTAEKVPGH